MHLDDERVQRFVHGEAEPELEAEVCLHLEGCLECRRRLARVLREDGALVELLKELDHPPPSITAREIAARAGGAGRSSTRIGRWAAGVVVAVGVAGAAYAAPGSPLPAWWRAAEGWMGRRTGEARQEAITDRGLSGVAVVADAHLTVVFTSVQAEGAILVRLGEGLEVMVRAPEGAASFTTGADTLIVENRGSRAEFRVLIPRDAPRVEIRVGGRRVFLKEGNAVLTGAPSKGDPLLGPWRVPLTPPP